jgi:uncharacterized alpha-E superfamily protein
MLSRTADHLYWMSRYTERAENTARMLDVNVQTSLLPQSPAASTQAWQGLLSISELHTAYHALYGEVKPAKVLEFMVNDVDNPSSIVSCLQAARENARAVRGTLTTEVWETHNQTWLELQQRLAQGDHEKDPPRFFEWVKFRSHLSRGVTVGTMLMDESLHFVRLGTFLERADNTARLLDVKFHALEAESPHAWGSDAQDHDFYHWSALLRSVSGFEIYRRVYRDVIRPDRVAELLVLRPDMPRSLKASMNEVVINLSLVANAGSKATERLAGKLHAELQYGDIQDILASGLHAYLIRFLDQVNELGQSISRDFLLHG